MEVELLDIYSLEKSSLLSAIKCADFSEAAAVCLEANDHFKGVTMKVEGDFSCQFKLKWKAVSPRMKNSREDMAYTVESGAYCLAMLVVEKLTGLKVTRQSQKRTGFDYWLGDVGDLGMQNCARLEVSGILKGNLARINSRLKEKIKQTKKSDTLDLPAYVVIVEFSQPLIKIKKRC